MKIKITSDLEWSDGFLSRIQEDGPWANWELYKLAIEVAQNLIISDFEGLQAPKHLPHLNSIASST